MRERAALDAAAQMTGAIPVITLKGLG